MFEKPGPLSEILIITYLTHCKQNLNLHSLSSDFVEWSFAVVITTSTPWLQGKLHKGLTERHEFIETKDKKETNKNHNTTIKIQYIQYENITSICSFL